MRLDPTPARGLVALSLVLAATHLARPARAQEPAPAVAAAVRTRLERLRERAPFPGVSVAWLRGDDVPTTLCVGSADRAGERPLSPADRLMSGSIGKTYVAALALLLVADGALGLDDRVADHLGELTWYARVPNAEALTVRMLLRHTSGVPEHVRMATFDAAVRAEPMRRWRPAELVAFVLDAKPLFAAGEGWSYADTNYVLLGMVLEAVGGAPYYTQLRDRILAPLALDDTVPTDRRDVPGLVCGHTSGALLMDAGPTVEEGAYRMNPQFEWCGGGLASTPRDLARWTHLLHRGAVFPPERRDELRAAMLAGVAAPMLGRGARYGLGVIVRDTPLGPCHGHSGIMPGYLSVTGYFPEHDLTVAVQFNTDVPREVGQRLERTLDEIAALLVDGVR